MSTEAKNVRLDAPVLAALKEAAARRHKTLDEMASEAVIEGLKAERLNSVRALLAKGYGHGTASGIPETCVVDVIHADRKQRRRAR
jgi:hypothetical protein